MRVIWLDEARDDLKAIKGYIGKDNREAARRVVGTIVRHANTTLGRFPLRSKEGRAPDTHELVVSDYPNYIVVYVIHQEHPTVLRVLHAAQEWPATLRHPR